MPPKRKGGFFGQAERPEDEAARQREVESLLSTRRTFPQEIGIERITPNPYQARREFPDLEDLAEAIRQLGFTSRLRVRPDSVRPGYFQLVYGERRLRAAKLAGLAEVPCDVAEHTDEELIEVGLAENIQRRDLDPLEEAHAFQTFIVERGYSIRRLAERIGKGKGYIEDRLKLLRAPDDIQQMIAERPDALRSARELAKLPSAAERAQLIAGVVDGTLNTAGVRKAVRDRVSSDDAILEPPRSANERQVERDAHAMQVILERWVDLVDRDAAAGETIAAYTQILLDKFQQVVTSIEA